MTETSDYSEQFDSGGARVFVCCEYGPFGELVHKSGSFAAACPFRFSTKYQDDESDLLYYGKRYLNTSTGRWLNRDLIGEKGDKNLYLFARNRPLTFYDILGNETAYIKFHEQYTVEVTPSLAPFGELCKPALAFETHSAFLGATVSLSFKSGLGADQEFIEQQKANFYGTSVQPSNSTIMSNLCAATLPTPWTRLSIGVGEVVNLSISPVPSGTVTWTLSGDGILSCTNASGTFTAPATAQGCTIVATSTDCGSPTWTKTFDIVAPSGVLFENASHDDPYCDGSGISVEYSANTYIQPDTVNFSAIVLYESYAAGDCEGWMSAHHSTCPSHSANRTHGVGAFVAGKGTAGPTDYISGGFAPPPTFTAGTLTWAIDWDYSVPIYEPDEPFHLIQTVNQIFEIDVGGETTSLSIVKGESGYEITKPDCTIEPY